VLQLALPIRFSDTDAMGHVNNARFLSYLEDSRLAMLAKIHDEGVDLGMGGVIVARVECDYVRPILLAQEPLDVYVWIERIGTKSFTFGHRIEQHGEVACRALSVVAAYDYEAARSRVLQDDERAALQRHMAPAPR
jgi:acyl-CoA thioester hydrolase